MLKKEVEQVYAIAAEVAEKKIKEALAALPKPEVIIKKVVVEKIVEKELQSKRKAKEFETTTKRK